MNAGRIELPALEILPAFEEDTGFRFAPRQAVRGMLDAGSAAGQQCRLLAARLVALGRDRRLQRIGVIGATRGQGASTVAIGLVRALASEPGRRVLLLDLDLRRPGLDCSLGLRPRAGGFVDYLQGRTDVPVVRRHESGFWLLSGGPQPAGAVPTVGSRLATLFRAADRVFDYVVADCPPVREGGQALDELDGFVLVVRSRYAPRRVVSSVLASFPRGKLIGTVLNGARGAGFRLNPGSLSAGPAPSGPASPRTAARPRSPRR